MSYENEVVQHDFRIGDKVRVLKRAVSLGAEVGALYGSKGIVENFFFDCVEVLGYSYPPSSLEHVETEEIKEVKERTILDVAKDLKDMCRVTDCCNCPFESKDTEICKLSNHSDFEDGIPPWQWDFDAE